MSADALEQRIAERARAFRGEMGVAAKDLATGRTVAFNADARFPTASTIKVAVMVEAFHQMAEGRLRRDEVIPLREEDKVGGSGVLRGLAPGLALRVSDLLNLMITVSDNTATNLIVDRVGVAAVNRRLESYGLAQTKLFRGSFRDRAAAHPELEPEFGLGMTTPDEMARLLELIAEGRVVSRATGDEMLAILAAQKLRYMIPRGLPTGDGIVVANKTGEDDEKRLDASGRRGAVRADVAVVTTPDTSYVIAIYTRRGEDTRWTVDNASLVVGGEVARLVHEAFAGR